MFKELENVKEISLKLSIEKMILDIDTRMMNFVSKSTLVNESIKNGTINAVNHWAEEKKIDLRLIDTNKITYATAKTAQEIEKLLDNDWNDNRGEM